MVLPGRLRRSGAAVSTLCQLFDEARACGIYPYCGAVWARSMANSSGSGEDSMYKRLVALSTVAALEPALVAKLTDILYQ